MSSKRLRIFFGLLFLACLILLMVGVYIEYADGVLPCTLCVLQRFAYGAVAIVAFVGFLHRFRCWANHVYGVFCFIFSAAGLGLAARQVWLQLSPADPNAVCVPGLHYLFKTLPFTKALMTALAGSADCGMIHWQFWSLSMAEWSLVCFICLTIASFVMMFLRVSKN
jgi:protein dithiol:quinone oxidoreductase